MELEFLDHLQAKKLSIKTIEQYLIHLRLFNEKYKDLEQKTVNKFVKEHQGFISRSFLRNLFEFLVEQKILSESDLPKIPKIKGHIKKLEKDVIEIKDLKKIRKYLLRRSNYKYVLMFDLTYYCGLRREEITSINKDSFNWEVWEKGMGLRLKVYSKGKERIVIVPSKIAEKISKYFIRNIEKVGYSERFFNIQNSRWHKIFKNAVRKVTEKNITLHDLRRKRATLWLDQGVDLDEVRRRLGHSSLATTQRYLIRDEEDRLKKWENE